MQLKTFLSLSPGYVHTFFTTYIVENFKTILDLLLVCPDKSVRSMIAGVMAYTVNILITFHDLPLDIVEESTMDEEKAKINKSVLDFLANLFIILPNEVAKNWNKFQQYFDVILLLLKILFH